MNCCSVTEVKVIVLEGIAHNYRVEGTPRIVLMKVFCPHFCALATLQTCRLGHEGSIVLRGTLSFLNQISAKQHETEQKAFEEAAPGKQNSCSAPKWEQPATALLYANMQLPKGVVKEVGVEQGLPN